MTKETFHNYFSEEGTLLDNVSSDELVFEGDFAGIDVNYMTIGKSIKLSGKNTALNGVTFMIGADNVTIDGFALNQSDVYLFYIEGVKGVTLSNNVLDYKAVEGVDSYAIYANAVSDLTITNNTINYVGNTDGTVVNNAICVTGDEDLAVASEKTVVEGNIFNIAIPSVDVGYDPDTWAAKVMSEGIVFYYCEDVKFIDNRVDLKYNTYSSAYGYDSVYAVSVRSDAYSFGEVQSSDVVIADNTINVDGHACAYGIYVCADDFEISNNEINSTSETYLAHAIDVDGPSAKGIVSENTINVESPIAVYGIYSYQYMGAIEDIAYVNNTITGESYAACGMEVVECNPYIEGNEITMNGNYTYGIVASIRDNGTIFANNVDALGINVGDSSSGDSLLPKNSLGVSVKGDALISGNNIESTGIGVNLVEDGTVTLCDNNIDVDTEGLVESYAIYSNGISNLVISDNAINFFGNTDGTVVNNAILITGDDVKEVAAKNITVKDNIFSIIIPSVDVGYDPDTWAAKVMSEGIVFYYCEDVKFIDNSVDLKYNNYSTAYGYDSVYAVSVRSDAYSFGEVQSSDVVIANNTINVDGHACTYAVYVCADNFEISNNEINSTAETYLAHAIDVDGPSAKGIVSENKINVKSPSAVYGIYSYQYMGAIEDIAYVNNTITGESYAACAMEIVECNPYIEGNEITMNGNYTYGIVASIRDNGTIFANTVDALGTNVGDTPSGDGLLPKNSLGVSVKGDALISGNNIESTGIGVNLVEEGTVTINNNNIDVDTAGLVESYAIYSDKLSNLVISDNAINFFGNTNGTVVNNAIRVNGDDDDSNPAAAKNITVKDNKIAIIVPSVDVVYDPLTYEASVYSEGIVFYYCDGVEFTNNDVYLKYDNASGSYDTIYVVSVKGDAYTYDFDADYNLVYPVISSNVVISNNNITGEGHKYIYGVYVNTADNVTIKDNNINMSADDYYAAGINLDGPAFNGVVENNEITVTAPGAVYGVYTGGWLGAVENITYENNTITADAYAACAMEVKEANPYISNNKITAKGNYTYGIVASISDNATIASNEITCVGSEVGNQSSGDSLLPKNSLAISVKGDALIENNTVDTSGVGVKTLDGEVNVTGNDIKTTGDKAIEAKDTTLTVENNYLASKTGVGQNAVSSNKDVTFVNNSPSLKTIISAPTLYTEYVDGVVFPVALLDENGDPIANKTLLATINGVVYNQTTDADGLAVFVLDFDAGSYDVVVSFKGDDVYGPKAVNSKIVVDQSPSEIVAPASSTIFLVTVKSGSYYTLTLKDLNGNGLANEKVTITFNGKTAKYTTDSLGVIKYKLSATKVGTYKLKMNFAGDNNYVASDATATIKLTKQATKITAKAKTFKAKTKIKKYTITLKDSKGKVIKKAKVTLKIKGKTYKAKTNAKGKATFKIKKLTKKGTYKAKVKFAATKYYNASTKSVKIKVKK